MRSFDQPRPSTQDSALPVTSAEDALHTSPVRGRIVLICLVIFLVALGVRLLSWQDNRFEARKVQTGVTANYKLAAQFLLDDGINSFLSSSAPLATPDLLGHPPGYSFLLALIFKAFGDSDAAIQIFQILCDASAALVVFFIAVELLLPRAVATLAGLFVALAPQFAYNSVMLLPDTLAVLPILLAIYFLIRASKRPSLAAIAAAGALVGLSCWLRANALLLAPFLALAIPFLFERGRRLRYALVLVCAAAAVIAPITIRNLIVFRHFIPVSLGAGQTLLEGIADYDEEQRFGIPPTDVEISRQEAANEARPDYAETLFGPDGIKRERARLARGFAVIRAHPIWFLGVVLQRAASMLRLERVRIISIDPPAELSWMLYPRALIWGVQRLFITAWMLPLTIIGVWLLARARQSRAVIILLAVPAYYLCIQSALHTEYRYVMALHYFLFVFAAFAAHWAAATLWRGMRKVVARMT